jgi:hypothetical protein
MQMAFAYLVSHGLVAVRLRDGQAFASINYERLVARLRNEQQYLIANPADTATCRALSYFRSRRLLTKSPWLDRLMADVNGVEAEPVEDRRAVSTPETSPAPLRTRGPHGTAGGAPEHA